MALRNRTLLCWLLVVASVSPLTTWGQESQKAPIEEANEALSSGRQPAAATIEKIMAQAVRNIALRYNLNDVQTEETDKLMRREVYRFLREHENEVWPAIRDLLATQLGTKPPQSKEDIMRIGKAARPLAKLAKEAIFRANEEWRLLLTPEQRKMHDFDLAEMEKTFEQIDEAFSAWEAGEPPEGGIFPPPQLAGQPPRPPRPPHGRLPNPEVEIFNPKSIFEALVEEFIREYELDDGQVTSARSILEEFKDKADAFRDAQKIEFAKIAIEQQQAYAERDLDAIRKAAAAHKKLLKPIYELCDEMDERLRGLLTTAQIQRHAERAGKPKKDDKAATVRKERTPKKSAAKTGPGQSQAATSDSG